MNVYWTLDHTKAKGSLRVKEIEPVLKNINKNISKLGFRNGYTMCPAFRDYFNNVYGWKSIYTYSIKEDTKATGYKSDLYNQEFFNRHITIRSFEEKLISFYPYVSFVTDSPSLELSIEHPYFEDNKFTSTCYVIPGILDIGKYYRHLDFAFHIKKDHKTFAVDEGEVLFYLRFHTKEKIKFKQYYMTDRLREYQNMITDIKQYSKSVSRPISFFYELYKKRNLKNKILKEIRENLV